MAKIFGMAVTRQLAALERITPQLMGFSYEFRPVDEFTDLIKVDIPEAMRIYWREMLFRVHWAASVGLVRISRWASGIVSGYEGENLLLFAAASRGFVESAADSHDAMKWVAGTLAC